jgi:hypothetical protein
MLKKFFLTFIVILCFLSSLTSQDSIASRIIVFREPNYAGAALSYKIFINNQMVVRLRNNTYYEYYCPPGQYSVFLRENPNNKVSINVEEGQTYYVKFGMIMKFFGVIPELVPVEAQWANEAIERNNMIKIDESNKPIKRPRNRIGLNFNLGIGFKQIPMAYTTNGDESNISFGGGLAFGFKYGYEFSKHFDFATDINYQISSLSPSIGNGSVSFSRWNLSVTPSLIIPIDGGYAMRLKLGGGLNYNFTPILKIDLNDIASGFNDSWKYKSALGYHFSLIWEVNYTESFSAILGLKYINVQYEFESSRDNRIPALDLRRTDGQGLDMVFGVYYHF